MASVHVRRDEGGAVRTFLSLTRADLAFQNLGTIRGMIAVDGVENIGGGKDLYMRGVEGGFEGTFTTLYGCLFEDGNCRTLLGMGTALGTPQLLHQHLQGVERAGVREGRGGGTTEGRSAGSR